LLRTVVMLVVNSQLIEPSLARPGQTGKFILNESAIIFFSTSQQHNSVKLHGLSYEDHYRGNALAGTFANCRIDIRFHRDFSDEHLRTS
jgi:hypothetical protein